MEAEGSSHVVFRNNPINLKDFVNQYVEISKKNGEISRGTVYTIDPVSESVLLLTRSSGKESAELILGHAVEGIQVAEKPFEYEAPNESLFAPNVNALSSKTTDGQKRKLMAWLNENRIPITECGDLLKIENMLTIYPPYYAENAVSQNEMILERVQNLIKCMTTGE